MENTIHVSRLGTSGFAPSRGVGWPRQKPSIDLRTSCDGLPCQLPRHDAVPSRSEPLCSDIVPGISAPKPVSALKPIGSLLQATGIGMNLLRRRRRPGDIPGRAPSACRFNRSGHGKKLVPSVRRHKFRGGQVEEEKSPYWFVGTSVN